MTPVYSTLAVAPALRPEREPADQRETSAQAGGIATEPPVQARKKISYQPSLFSSRELPRVVPFETIAPDTVLPSCDPSPAAPRTRHRRLIPGQQSLEFISRPPKQPDGVIYCDAPVALPAHRVMAAAMDASMILIALALFGTIFYSVGGTLVISSKTVPLFVGIAGALLVFYKVLWCLAGGDTAGMRWARLTLVDFDGRMPDRRQRFYRLASGTLSLLAAGIGLLWALVDEETLTWHDHISKTFPTPY